MNPYGAKTNEANIIGPLTFLEILYSELPKTVGCEKCVSVNGKSRKDWCCLGEGTIIYTPNGPIVIEDIKSGDLVYTRGGIRRVKKTGKRKICEQIIRLKSVYGRSIVLTKDHRVLCDCIARRDRGYHVPQFVAADYLLTKINNKPSSYLIFPKITDFLKSNLKHINVSSLLGIECDVREGRCFNSTRKHGSSIPQCIEITPDISFMIGLFLAEGSSSNGSVVFHLHRKEEILHDKVYEFASRFGLKCASKIDHGDAMTLRISSRILSRVMSELCGSGCQNKRVHPDLFHFFLTSRENRKALLSGIYAGDGSKTKGRSKSITTTSHILCHQMLMLYQMEGVFCGLVSYCRTRRKRVYIITWTDDPSYTRVLETGIDFRVVLVKKEEEHYEGFVYDLEIENGDSFFTEAGEVHNCKELNPSMFYVEFLHVWKEVQNKWKKSRRRELIFRAIMNYLRNDLKKGCIFYQDGCLIHSRRPLSCHMYAVTPKEVWKERIDQLKERYGEDFPVQDQCDLVTTEDGREYVSSKDDDKWFDHVRKCEKRLGVTPDVLRKHDLPGGSYRTFHDHLLIELFPLESLEALTKYRLTNPTEDDIEHVVDEIIDRMNEPPEE